ncbi:MAG: Snf7 family protein [Nitrosopumilaceae archaeon]
MISKWSINGKDGSLSQKVLDKVKPEAPVKNKIDEAQKKLQFQITKLDGIHEKLQKKHDFVFDKIVTAQRSDNQTYAKAYAIELNQIRKMRNMIGGAKLAMEQIQIRLNTVSELGDVVVTLSPAMSIIKGLGTSLGGLMPEANAYMEDLSNMLGDVVKGSTVSSHHSLSIADNTSTETYAILEEAHNIIEGRAKATIPEVPSELKEEVELKKEAFI